MIEQVVIYRAGRTSFELFKDIPFRIGREDWPNNDAEHSPNGRRSRRYGEACEFITHDLDIGLAVGECALFDISTEYHPDPDPQWYTVPIGHHCVPGRAELLGIEEVDCEGTSGGEEDCECPHCGDSHTNYTEANHDSCGYECNGEKGWEEEPPDTIWIKKVSRTHFFHPLLGVGDDEYAIEIQNALNRERMTTHEEIAL